MIGDNYLSRAVQAIIGPNHALTIPDVLWGGFLDENLDLIAMTGQTVPHAAFGPTDTGVTNITPIECGVAGAGWDIRAFGLFDASAGGSLVALAVLSPATPDEDETLIFNVGDLTFTFVSHEIS